MNVIYGKGPFLLPMGLHAKLSCACDRLAEGLASTANTPEGQVRRRRSNIATHHPPLSRLLGV